MLANFHFLFSTENTADSCAKVVVKARLVDQWKDNPVSAR